MTGQEARTTKIEKNIQLLVEGNDHKNFFEAFLKHLSLTNVQIQDFGGVDELRGFLLAIVKTPEFDKVQSVGIVRDAEESENAAFQSVQSSLRNAKLSAPNRHGERTDHNPAVTVLILPGDGRAGMLETLLCQSVADSPERPCIDTFLQCVRELHDEDIKRPAKACAHAYLATRPDPHVSVGVAAKKGYWDLGHSVLDGIRQFLRGL